MAAGKEKLELYQSRFEKIDLKNENHVLNLKKVTKMFPSQTAFGVWYGYNKESARRMISGMIHGRENIPKRMKLLLQYILKFEIV